MIFPLPSRIESHRRDRSRRRRRTAAVWLALVLIPVSRMAIAVSVTDDSGAMVTLERPAERIVSLAPHATELLFAAGAGDRIVGAVKYSDYPPAARRIPRVGGYKGIDLERVLALEPDLVVGWQSGNGPEVLERIEHFGFAVYRSEPRRLADIAAGIQRLGVLAGTDDEARRTADGFEARLARLKARYSRRPTVSVFYQVWHRPLVTVGGDHFISKLIDLCGGVNVFADLDTLAPTVGTEAVLAADPDAIVASGMDENRPEWLDDWRRWDRLRAVAADHLYFIPPDLVQRPTPRLLDGAERLCEALEDARGGAATE